MALPSNHATGIPVRHTAAHREGGKFGAAATRRDKFAALAAASAAAAPSSAAAVVITDHPPSSSTTTAATTTATKPPPRIRVERQKQVFADLNAAEDLALELLKLADSTCEALRELTSPPPNNNNKGTEGGDDEKSEEELEDLTRRNGVEYLTKVQRIHSLLSPHANLVVAYRNHAVDTNNADEEEDVEGGGNIPAPPPGGTRTAAASSGAVGPTSIPETKKKKPPRKNMYASRVEMRLAMERKDVLNEMLRLEQEEEKEEKEEVLDGTVSGKRKRDE